MLSQQSSASYEDTNSEDVRIEARQLRMDLEVQLEKARSLSFEDQVELSAEEQLSELVLLVSQYSEEALQQSVLMTTISDPTHPSYTGRFPLHLACDTNAPIEIIQFLLEQDPTRQSVRQKDKWGDLPIHTACSRRFYNQVCRLLLEADSTKETIYTARVDGSLPIHTACRYNAPPEVILMLLDHDKGRKSLFIESLYGQLPLHVACRCNLQPDSLKVLLDYDVDKKSVLFQDTAGRLPIHVAYLYKSHPESICLLLHAMIHGRMERVGLLNWKVEISHFIHHLEIPERDFNASDKMEMTRGILTDLLERACLLELGVWKASCCRQDHDVALPMTTPVRELSHSLKQERRIRSGAEMIIPGVLSFLEDEPIEKLLQEFQ